MKQGFALFLTILIGLGTAFESLSCTGACQPEQTSIGQADGGSFSIVTERYAEQTENSAEESDMNRSHCHLSSCMHTQFLPKSPVAQFIGQTSLADFSEVQFLYQSPIKGNLKRPPIA